MSAYTWFTGDCPEPPDAADPVDSKVALYQQFRGVLRPLNEAGWPKAKDVKLIRVSISDLQVLLSAWEESGEDYVLIAEYPQ